MGIISSIKKRIFRKKAPAKPVSQKKYLAASQTTQPSTTSSADQGQQSSLSNITQSASGGGGGGSSGGGSSASSYLSASKYGSPEYKKNISEAESTKLPSGKIQPSISATDFRATALKNIGQPSTPPLTRLERIRNVPGRVKTTIKEGVGYGNYGLIGSELGTAFGLWDKSHGKPKAEEKIPTLPYQEKGTIDTSSWKGDKGKTYGDVQMEAIAVTGGSPSNWYEKKIVGDITTDLQSQIDAGKITVEEAETQFTEQLEKKTSSPDYQMYQASRGVAAEDLSIKPFKLTTVTQPATAIGLFAASPVVGGAIFGAGLISSGVPDLGKGTLGKDLTFSERGKLLGTGTLKTGLGLNLFGTSLGSIGKGAVDVEREAFGIDKLSKDAKFNWGLRTKLNKITIDKFTAESKTGSTSKLFDVKVTSRQVGKKVVSTIEGTETSKFFSFATGKGTSTVTSFRGVASGKKLFEPTKEGWISYFGGGKTQQISQVSFRDLEKNFLTGKISKPKYTLGLDSKQAESFQFIGVGKEDTKRKLFGFISGDKPTMTIDYVEGQGLKLTGVDLPVTDVGLLKISDLTVKKAGSSSFGSVATSGRKSSTGFLSSLTTTAPPIVIPPTKIIKSMITKPLTTSTSPATTVIGRGGSAYAGLGMYERTGGGLEVGGLGNIKLDLNLKDLTKQSSLNKLFQFQPLKQDTSTKTITIPNTKTILRSQTKGRQKVIPITAQTQPTAQRSKTITSLGFVTPKIKIPHGMGRGGFTPGFGVAILKFNLYGSKSKPRRKKGRGYKPPFRIPSLAAIGLDIRSKKKGIVESSGFTIRPILTGKTKRKKTKKRVTKRKAKGGKK